MKCCLHSGLCFSNKYSPNCDVYGRERDGGGGEFQGLVMAGFDCKQ